MPTTLPIVAAFLLTVLLHLAALRLFPRLGLLDFPERYGLARARLPYPSGVIAVAVFVALFPVIVAPSAQATGVLAAVTLLGATSVADDRRGLPPGLRLGVQAAAGAILFLSGTRIYSLTNPLEPWTGIPVLPLDRLTVTSQALANPSVVGLAFTVGWIMLTVNALNWLDGIRGQVSVLACIGFSTIGLLSLSERVAQPELALVAFTLAAIAAGSALFDLPRAVVLGDTGAMFFGLMAGVLTVYAGGKVATAFLVLGIPLVDSMLVIARRLRSGRSPFRGSARGEHLHHRLQEAGWSDRQVIALNAAVGTGFGTAALFLDTWGKFVAALVLTAMLVALSAAADRVIARRSASAR